MTMMYHDEAKEIIKHMRDTAVNDCVNLQRRITELKAEYEHDAWEETAKQISRLEMRLEKRVRETKALALAAVQFPEDAPVGGIGLDALVRVIQTSHPDLLWKYGTVERITASGNYEVAVGSEIVVLGPAQIEKANPHYYPPIKESGNA